MNSPQTIHFSNDEEKAIWVESILADFREGIATPEDIESLRILLLNDADVRALYLKSNTLTTLLESTSSMTSEVPESAPFPIARWAAGLGVAAALAFGAWFSLKTPNAPTATPDPIAWLATLSSSNEPVWSESNFTDGQFFAGNYALQSGVAELEFQNGARFIIEGPCALEIINESKIELNYGKLWGHCPPTAHGFEVLAPGGKRVVDLGTEFGIGVATSGEIEVHVFDGEVEVYSQDQERQALDAGSAIKFSPGKEAHPLNANVESFTDTHKLQSDLYQRHHASLLQRNDLLFYCDFNLAPGDEHRLIDQGTSQLHGEIKGALPVKGRMADKGALLFEKKKDAVAVNLENLQLGKEFTLAMWIKPTDFSRSHMALLNSDGFEPGDIHFQIHDDGKLMSAIAGMNRHSSPRGIIGTNIWQFVAVTWNLENETAQLYLNGEAIKSNKSTFKRKDPQQSANFGKCQIGSWAKPSYGHNRSFEGRMDEVMIFSRQLSEKEMSDLFEASRP